MVRMYSSAESARPRTTIGRYRLSVWELVWMTSSTVSKSLQMKVQGYPIGEWNFLWCWSKVTQSACDIGVGSCTWNFIVAHTHLMDRSRKAIVNPKFLWEILKWVAPSWARNECVSILIISQYVATLASIYKLHKIDYVYPRQRINDNWEKVLLNQCMFFHFVLWRSLLIFLPQSMMVIIKGSSSY